MADEKFTGSLRELIERGFVGSTGKFPDGKIDTEEDEGQLNLAMAADPAHGVVRIVFGKPCAWLALTPEQARSMAVTLNHYADELSRRDVRAR